MVEGRPIPFASMSEIERIETTTPWPPDFTMTVAGAAYVVSERKFSYTREGKAKQACEYVLDIDGGRIKVVKWPVKHAKDQHKLPVYYQRDLTGSVIVALLSKRNESKPFALEELVVVQDPLGQDSEESP